MTVIVALLRKLYEIQSYDSLKEYHAHAIRCLVYEKGIMSMQHRRDAPHMNTYVRPYVLQNTNRVRTLYKESRKSILRGFLLAHPLYVMQGERTRLSLYSVVHLTGLGGTQAQDHQRVARGRRVPPLRHRVRHELAEQQYRLVSANLHLGGKCKKKNFGTLS